MQIKNWVARILAISAIGLAANANAGLTLTAAGTGQGFTLSTFASGIPSVSGVVGPLGIGFTPGGGVMVVGYTGEIRVFATDTDNQTWASATAGPTNYGYGNPAGLAQVGGKFYLAEQAGNKIDEVSATGAFIRTVVGVGGATGLVADAATGKLYVSGLNGTQGIYQIDPVANTAVLKIAGSFDGLSISGNTLYAENLGVGEIQGFNLTTNAQVYASGYIAGADGVAIGTGSLANSLFINTNYGELWEQDITTHVLTLLANGGSRGDFVQVDPNGSLLITQTDSIMRLTAASGGGFETSVPEPGTLALVGLAIAGLGLRRRKN